jgi:hypothetical protein
MFDQVMSFGRGIETMIIDKALLQASVIALSRSFIESFHGEQSAPYRPKSGSASSASKRADILRRLALRRSRRASSRSGPRGAREVRRRRTTSLSSFLRVCGVTAKVLAAVCTSARLPQFVRSRIGADVAKSLQAPCQTIVDAKFT